MNYAHGAQVGRALATGALLLLINSCGDPTALSTADQQDATPSGTLVSDTESRLSAELLRADREFARQVRAAGLEGWVAAFSDDAMVLPADGSEVVGPVAIRELFVPLFAEPGFEITWAPAGAEVAASGDLGYTYGDWQSSVPGAGGAAEDAQGKYLTIWRRDATGRWKVQLDIGNTRSLGRADFDLQRP